MNARQLLTQAIDAYNMDTFDDEQKHLHVTLREDDDILQSLVLTIPSKPKNIIIIEDFLFFNDIEKAYSNLLIKFIYYSLQNLTK